MENKSSDSEYIEMTRRGLELERESIYDVIPADDHGGTQTSVSNDHGDYLAPASCQRLYEPSAKITQSKGRGTKNPRGGSRIKMFLLTGCGTALVCLSVGITLITIYTANVMKETDPADENKPDPNFNLELDIRKLVKVTLFTNTAIDYRVIKLLPPFVNPLEFMFEIFNADRIPFRVNERGVVLVKGGLTATVYEFIVKVTNQRLGESVLVTVIIRCKDPNETVSSSVESDEIGIISLSTVNSGLSNIPLTSLILPSSGIIKFSETYPNWPSTEQLAISPSKVHYSSHQMSSEITTGTETTQFLASVTGTTLSLSSILISDSFIRSVFLQESSLNLEFYATYTYHTLSPSFNGVIESTTQYTNSLTPSLSTLASTERTVIL